MSAATHVPQPHQNGRHGPASTVAVSVVVSVCAESMIVAVSVALVSVALASVAVPSTVVTSVPASVVAGDTSPLPLQPSVAVRMSEYSGRIGMSLPRVTIASMHLTSVAPTRRT